jgi:hypothetical protein
MSSSKKNSPVKDFAAGVYLNEAQNPHTLTHCILYAVYLFTRGGGRGQSSTREKVRGATVHIAGPKIPR